MSQPPYNQPPGGFGPQGNPPYNQQQPGYAPGGPGPNPAYNAPGGLDRSMVTTGLEFGGFKIKRYLGVVRGITVRSRSVLGNIGAGFQSLVGGKITIYVELCEKAREEAFELMLQHAAAMGANAIVGMRYDANEVADGITEVLAYGTAVWIQPMDSR